MLSRLLNLGGFTQGVSECESLNLGSVSTNGEIVRRMQTHFRGAIIVGP